MIKFNCKHDFLVFSWGMEHNWEVLVIFILWPKLHTRTLQKSWKLMNFEVGFHSLDNWESQWKWANSIVNTIYKCFFDEWNRIKKFLSFSNLTKTDIRTLAEILKIDQFLKFFLIHCKTVKLSQNDQILV